jgi:CBS-domain-containing membrane protein
MNPYDEIGKIMTTDLVTIKDDTPVNKIKGMFNQRSIHHILVENNVGELMGIISPIDMGRTAHFSMPEDQLVAKHVMTASPESISPSMPIKEVVDYFLDNRFRAIPIVNKDKVLIGIVTPYDIMSTLMDTFRAENEDLIM